MRAFVRFLSSALQTHTRGTQRNGFIQIQLHCWPTVQLSHREREVEREHQVHSVRTASVYTMQYYAAYNITCVYLTGNAPAL